jgi:hypothetical protein
MLKGDGPSGVFNQQLTAFIVGGDLGTGKGGNKFLDWIMELKQTLLVQSHGPGSGNLPLIDDTP